MPAAQVDNADGATYEATTEALTVEVSIFLILLSDYQGKYEFVIVFCFCQDDYHEVTSVPSSSAINIETGIVDEVIME